MATQLKDIQSIESILSEMTLEEKAEMIQGSSPFRSAAMPKYGIPPIYMIDTCTGLNSFQRRRKKTERRLTVRRTAIWVAFFLHLQS